MLSTLLNVPLTCQPLPLTCEDLGHPLLALRAVRAQSHLGSILHRVVLLEVVPDPVRPTTFLPFSARWYFIRCPQTTSRAGSPLTPAVFS